MRLNEKLFLRKVRAAHTRRDFMRGVAATLGIGALGGTAMAQGMPRERKFLFFWAGGGWDTTAVLDPHYEGGPIDMEPDSVLGQRGRLNWTSGPARMQADRFFRRWGDYASIINGIDVHSVGHDTASQFVLTGTSASSFSDWPTILAANSRFEYPLPHVVFSGPSFPGTYGAAVVRAGGGTLLELIDGSILGRADRPAPVPAQPMDSQVDAFVHQRIEAFAAKQTGLGKARADGLLKNMERTMELEGRRFEAGLDDLGNNVLDQAVKATELFRLGLSRCAMIRIPGGYDTHSSQLPQGVMQDNFYGVLDELFDHLSRTPGHSAPLLIDEVVVVAMSEFGRTPGLNGGGGKDHWPYGSALVAGAGVNGGISFGSTSNSLVGETVDYSTGMVSDSGDLLDIESVGVSLLQLGGLDSQQFLPDVRSFKALQRRPR